jgi:sodium/pantothenate symporter
VFHNFLDPFFIGVYLAVAFAVIGSAGQKKSGSEAQFYENLHVTPVSELVPSEIRRTKIYCRIAIAGGAAIVLFLIFYWAAPYNGWV